jgi:uncharacterized protein (TIGR01244 family)
MSLALRPVDGRVVLSAQLAPADMKEIAAQGFVAVVNNRPDGEAMFGQPKTADLRAAAEAAGLAFLDLPFSGPRATPEQVRALADLLADGGQDGGGGRIVAFCKSGMRSALLWGAASLANGRSLDEVLRAARSAGHELEPVAELMTGLARAARA